jgi:putative endonuclease
MSKDYYIYILECTNGRLYTGCAVDIEKRFNEHVSGKGGAKFTRAFKPKKIIMSWRLSDGSWGEALRIEAYIKSLKRAKKLDITNNPMLLVDHIASLENYSGRLTAAIKNEQMNN